MIPVTHALVGGSPNAWAGGTHKHSLWCRERSEVSVEQPVVTTPDIVSVKDANGRGYAATKTMQLVTCKRCIALGGCGPDWKGES